MKKKIISLAALVVVLAVALGAYLFLGREEASVGEESSAVETLYVMGGIPQPFVKQVNIQNELDTFTIHNNHANAIAMQNADSPDFVIDGIEQAYLSASMMKSVATNCANLDAKKIVAEGGDFSAYGLDSPRATVEAVYEDGTATIQIGDEAPGSGGTYVRKDDTVYLVTSSKLTNMLLPRFGYVSKALTSGDAQSNAFTKLTLGGTKFPEPIVIVAPEKQDEQAASVGLRSYLITSPIQAEADTSKALEALSAVFGMTTQEVVAIAGEGDALTQYGLSQPYLTTEVETEDPEVGSFALHFSETDAEGNVYARRADRPFIYRISVDSIPWYGFDLFDYQQKMVILPFIDSLSQVDVVAGDQLLTFMLEGEGDDLVATLNGQEMDTKNFRRFYQTMISASYDAQLTADDEAPIETESETEAETEATGETAEEETPEEETEPEAAEEETAQPQEEEIVLQYTYHYRDGSPSNVVTFTPGPARRYLIRLNDGPRHYAKSLYVDKVMADLPKLLAGEEVKTYI